MRAALLLPSATVDVTFTKPAHPKDFQVWVAQAGKRRIDGAGLRHDPGRLPHDLVTFVVERELGIADGFFGTVAAGGTFRSMAKRRTRPGRAVIARNGPAVMAAEHTVNRIEGRWRAGQDSPCNAALDRVLAAWTALPPHGRLTLEWLPCSAHPAEPRRRRRR